jgi:cobalamin synthase
VRAAAHLARGGSEAAPAAASSLAWLPLVGVAFGAIAALVAVALGRWSAMLGGAAGLVALRLLEGSPATGLGVVLLMLEAAALLWAPVAMQALALVLAPLLGTWSRVVQCHGGRPVPGSERTGLVGRATFREFGVASVLAIGGALVLFDALGLVAVLGAVVPTILLRAALHRRRGGMPAWGPATTGRVAETVVMVVLCALSRW